MLKILTLSAEVTPFAKTGGLGDGDRCLWLRGWDTTRIAMPAYRAIEDAISCHY
jgi:glycogen synthase